MAKAFDPDAALVDARKTITDAQGRKTKAEEALKPIQARLDRANASLAKAQAKVTEQVVIIARAQAFIDRNEAQDSDVIEPEPAAV